MTRLRCCLIVAVAVGIVCTMNHVMAQDIVQSPATIEGTVSGRLATVEPARRRITLVPIGEVTIVELDLADNAQIIHANELLSLPALVVEVGKLVTVHYRHEGDRRIAQRVTIEASAG